MRTSRATECPGGSVIAVENSVLDDYLTHLELSGGAQPDKGEMRGLTYAPEAGIFSTFVDGLEACSLEEVSSAEPRLFRRARWAK